MHTLLLLVFFTCNYPGYVNHDCAKQLDKAARYMKAHPNTIVEIEGGDDETGEYLTDKGIEPTRIIEAQGRDQLIIMIRRAPKTKLIASIKVKSVDPREATLGCP